MQYIKDLGINCKYCGSNRISKYGNYKGVPRYWCNDCERKFKNDDCEYNMKVPKEHVDLALKLSNSPNSFRDLRKKLDHYFGHKYSLCVIYNWLLKHNKTTTPKQRSKIRKNIYKPLSNDEEMAIYANNTGIEIIDDLTRDIPLYWRSDIRQEIVLQCLLKNISFDNDEDVIEIIKNVQKKSKSEYYEEKYKTIDIFSKVFDGSDLELIDTIIDESQMFIEDLEKRL